MTRRKSRSARYIALGMLATALLAGSASRALAADHVSGIITERLESGFVMQKLDGAAVAVSFTDATRLKAERLRGRPSYSQLVPGLHVRVTCTVNGDGTLTAKEIKYDVADLRIANAIQAGLTPTGQRVQKNASDIQGRQKTLALQQEAIDAQVVGLALQSARLDDADLKIVATSGAVTSTNDRIGRLDQYAVVDSFTVQFPNRSATVPTKYLSPLADFAAKAKAVPGYVVQVQGYASAIGAGRFNQELSQQRADAVTAVLQQRGGIPSSNVFVPAAMGVTGQVGDNHTRQGQAENRRVVVTILQNTGIAQ